MKSVFILVLFFVSSFSWATFFEKDGFCFSNEVTANVVCRDYVEYASEKCESHISDLYLVSLESRVFVGFRSLDDVKDIDFILDDALIKRVSRYLSPYYETLIKQAPRGQQQECNSHHNDLKNWRDYKVNEDKLLRVNKEKLINTLEHFLPNEFNEKCTIKTVSITQRQANCFQQQQQQPQH